MTQNSPLMQGKRGVVLGVANNRSIAWGIAKACRAAGAEIALTWQGDALKKRVEPLAKELNGELLGHCDVTDPATIDAAFDLLRERWGKIDFVVHAIAFSDKDQLDGRYLETTADNFTRTMLISCYSLTAICQRAEKLLTDGGSILTLTYYGAEKWMPHYNVMGVAKAALEASVRYLAAGCRDNPFVGKAFCIDFGVAFFRLLHRQALPFAVGDFAQAVVNRILLRRQFQRAAHDFHRLTRPTKRTGDKAQRRGLAPIAREQPCENCGGIGCLLATAIVQRNVDRALQLAQNIPFRLTVADKVEGRP